MIQHIVMFKLKKNNPAQVEHLKQLLEALPARIQEIKKMRVELDILKSERSMDLALFASFESLEALNLYNEHPEHQKVRAWVQEHASLVKVVDFKGDA